MLQTMNIPKIMEDELFATYLDRLAESNGFISTNKFLMNILGEQSCSQYIKSNSAVLYRNESVFVSICSFLNINQKDILHIFQHSFIYPGISPFMNGSRQSAYIQSLFFSNVENRKKLIGVYQPQSYELRYCSECAAEEIESLGFMYFHTENQLPGVRICPKHKKLLLTTGKINHDNYDHINMKGFIECQPNADVVTMCDYSNAAFSIYNSWPDTDFANIRLCISRKMLQQGYLINRSKKDSIQSVIHQGRFEQIASNVEPLYHSTNDFLYPSGIPAYIAIILMLFKSMDEFISQVKKHDQDLIKHNLLRMGIETETDFNSSAMYLKHKCGHEFITAYSSVMDGFGCSACESNLSEKQMLDKVISASSNGHYSAAGNIDRLNGSIVLVDDSGATHRINRFYSYLYCGNRNYKAAKSYAEINEVLKKYGKFTLVKRDNTGLTIFHEQCRKTFHLKYLSIFCKHPFCRACDEGRKENNGQYGKHRKSTKSDGTWCGHAREYSDEYFNTELKKYGNYEIVDHCKRGHERKGHITIRHITCGGQFTLSNMTQMRMYPFCRCCGEGKENLKENSQKYKEGRKHVTSKKNNKA